MAGPVAGLVFFGPDRLERSVWVVVDPRDFVTGRRMAGPVEARLKGVTAEPIAGLSGVYCFTDLGLPGGAYTAHVQPLLADRAHYFDGDTEFVLAVIPVPGQPVRRNPVAVDLLPRPAYPFTDKATLARGRLAKASDGTGVEGARIVLILEGVDRGRRGRTDERGEFVVFFPPATPEDNASAGLKLFKFRLRFEISGQPPLLIPEETAPEETVGEGTTKSLKEIHFLGI